MLFFFEIPFFIDFLLLLCFVRHAKAVGIAAEERIRMFSGRQLVDAILFFVGVNKSTTKISMALVHV